MLSAPRSRELETFLPSSTRRSTSVESRSVVAKTIDYEVEVERYNKSAKRASLPQFATMMADDSTLLSGVSELDAIPPQSQVLTEQRLKYWFKLADPQTRNTFLQWAEKQPSS